MICMFVLSVSSFEGWTNEMKNMAIYIVKFHSRLDIRKHAFSQRVVNDRKRLREDCHNANSVN